MAKEPSPKVVSEEADYERRFQTLEETTQENSTLLKRLSEKLLGEDIKPEVKPKPKTNDVPPPPAPAKSFHGFMRQVGIFRAEGQE